MSNFDQKVSDQEPHVLGSDDEVPLDVDREAVPEEEDSIGGMPSNIQTVWETDKLEKKIMQKHRKRCGSVTSVKVCGPNGTT